MDRPRSPSPRPHAGPSTALAIALSLAAAPAAQAQNGEPGCWITRDGPLIAGNTAAYFDQNLTNNWLATLRSADGALMSQVAGTYYTETPAPQLGMVNYQYRSYDRTGLFEYQDRTCSQTGCSQNYGHGRWAAVWTNRSTIYLMVTWSDLMRTNACMSAEVYPAGADLVSAGDGQRWQRVR